MARSTARVLALLEILQSGGTRTVADLARRLEVDERTVRRYVDHLLDLDVPVVAIRGRHGGYRLAPGHRLPPLMLRDEEAVALLLGLVASRQAGLSATSVVAAESAGSKLRRVLPEPLRHQLDALVEAIDFTSTATHKTVPETRVMLMMAEAARDRRPVAITYEGRGGRSSDRTVFPYGIVAHRGRWYVTGSDSRSGEVRTFRLDRVTASSMLDGAFDQPPGFDPAGAVLDSLARTPWQYEVVLRVRDLEEQILACLPTGMPSLEAMADGWVRVTLRAEHLDWVPSVLARLQGPFVVEKPEELRGLVRALGRRMTAAGA